MIRRFLIILLLIGLCGFWIWVRWVESPAGAEAVSQWATAQIQQQVPGTRVTIDHLEFQFPFSFRLNQLRWGKLGQPPILIMNRLDIMGNFRRFWRRELKWKAKGKVDKLDLTRLDQVAAQGQWQAVGFLTGQVYFQGTGALVEDASIQLEAQSPGGTLGGEMLARLLSLLPTADVQSQLLAALQQQKIFHFHVGRFGVTTEDTIYKFHILLDGDHLLDITFRVQKDSVDAIKQLLELS